ncbi:hypothetical protein AB0H83_37630 [Dactylosporangium sp. NPDC050688]|uniref:hypothetical protein n=1 Tax=Dactylosporangium sp. NPDC050688 TaxID=3157217 RepID=UPI0033DCFF2F
MAALQGLDISELSDPPSGRIASSVTTPGRSVFGEPSVLAAPDRVHQARQEL